MILKTCKECGENLPNASFSKHPGTKDGMQPKCCCGIDLVIEAVRALKGE
jgi:hypothetical protein